MACKHCRISDWLTGFWRIGAPDKGGPNCRCCIAGEGMVFGKVNTCCRRPRAGGSMGLGGRGGDMPGGNICAGDCGDKGTCPPNV